jgi:hypothetical protein
MKARPYHIALGLLLVAVLAVGLAKMLNNLVG